MAPANKTRKSPSASATKFGVGVKKRGNDGNMWQIVQTKTGTKRWLKVASKAKSKKNTKAPKAVAAAAAGPVSRRMVATSSGWLPANDTCRGATAPMTPR